MADESDAKVLHVSLIAADRKVWEGEATYALARTPDGELGILAGHAPMLSLLSDGVVTVHTTDDEYWVAAVSSGFISVAQNRVSILAEQAEMSHEIDLEKARRDLERARSAGEDDDEAVENVRLAEARIRAVELAQ